MGFLHPAQGLCGVLYRWHGSRGKGGGTPILTAGSDLVVRAVLYLNHNNGSGN